MKIFQTKGNIKNGELKAPIPFNISNGEVDVIIVAANEPDEFEQMRSFAKEKGYDSPEKILKLIEQVKLEMLAEKGRNI